MELNRSGGRERVRVVAWPAWSNAKRNPYQSLMHNSLVSAGVSVEEFSLPAIVRLSRGDILHLHWPDVFLAASPRQYYLRLGFVRTVVAYAHARGAKVVWTSHNIKRAGQRNGSRLESTFWPWFTRHVDGVIFLTEASRGQAEERLPELLGARHEVIPHGHYRPLFPSITSAAQNDPPRLLFFGSLAAYKRPSALLRTFATLAPGSAEVRFVGKMSAREPDHEFASLMAQLPDDVRRWVSFVDRFVSEEELFDEVRSADLAVFPYDDLTSSGAAIFALSVGAPILTSDQPAFVELQSLVEGGWVRTYSGGLSSGELMDALVAAGELRESSVVPDLSKLDWDRLSAMTIEFYGSVRGATRRTRRSRSR